MTLTKHPHTTFTLSMLLGVLTTTSLTTHAAEKTVVELEEVKVTAKKNRDTKPVTGYNATHASTATRTDTDLVNVPQSVTVITKDLMQDQSMQSIADAVRYVPGVQAAQGEGNRDQLVLRGNNTTSDLFVDSLRDDAQVYRDLYNTDRIEVLKGPNGMIFGRGGAGGVVNRVSKKAGWDPVHDVQLTLGSFDQRRMSVDMGEGINDVLAFRLNAVHEEANAYRDGVWLKRYGITPTFTIKPDAQTQIELSAEYFKDERISDRGVPSVNSDGNIRLKNRPYQISQYDQFFGNAKLSPTEAETVAFNAAITHAFDNGVQIKNSTRLAYYDKFYQNVFAQSSVNNAGRLSLGAYKDFTKRENLINQTDITWSVKTGQIEHKLLSGIELNVQDTDNKRYTPTGTTDDNGTFLTTALASMPIGVPANLSQLRRNQQSDVTVFGMYLQDQIIFNPQWQAIVGLRQDHVDTDYTNFVSNTRLNVSNNLLSPRAGLIFKPSENSSIYANYSISYFPRAGDQLVSLTPITASFKPEKFINREIGIKWDITANASATAAVYQLQRENVLATNPTSVANSFLIDGQQITGLELGLSGKFTDQWSMTGGFTLQDGEITEDIPAFSSSGVRQPQNDILKGAQLALTPTRSFSLWNKYQLNETWAIALGAVSRSEMYALSPTASQSTVLPGYTRFDAAIFAKISPKWDAQVNIENLTNKDYALFAHNNNNITPGAPVNARATLNYHF